ncbi:MAG: 1-deoxy-D-xylulose-5-phosphate reductoisomerase [Alistipes sp.]|jgi:1-deoxy-D-xylulose-5-phosphate reductoisomerase|nr:1-deoxy-D-xylulose-5-phosphate reductoisomerase [Alistipes sp.]
MRQRVAILGSTGSIGEQTLEVLRLHPELFEPAVLTAHRNWRRLAEQARELEPDSVIIADREFYEPLRDALADIPVKVWAGEDAVAQAAEAGNVDVVVNALVGYAGLVPTVRAVTAGKKLALANKESLVCAGELVMRLSAESRAPVVPIDSEHSAILQCLVGEPSPVRRVILTASGGALRDVPISELADVTAERALAHPNWKMGAKITIDSATLMNKGFEVVEARWLFGLEPAQIDVLIHRQSIVHSMVEFADGAVKAQMGTPDMRVPIAYALSFPARLALRGEGLSLTGAALTFEEVDEARYPALALVRECMAAGGTALCALNAANEVAVAAFLEGRIRFTEIVRTVERTLERAGGSGQARPTLDDYIECNSQARRIAEKIVVSY